MLHRLVSTVLWVVLATAVQSSPTVDAAKKPLRNLVQDTSPGQIPPETRVPPDMNRFRAAVRAVGNAVRRAPNCRTGNKGANDFSGDQTRIDIGWETLVKDNAAPPCSNDLARSEELTQACQFHAEGQAKTRPGGHDGPGNLNSINNRIEHFAQLRGSVTERDGAAFNNAGAHRETWLKSEPHTRPPFNSTVMGFGIAERTNGGWPGCKIARVDFEKAPDTHSPVPCAHYGGPAFIVATILTPVTE